MLSLEASNQLLLQYRLERAAAPAGAVEVPRRVFQYWDRQPPQQIERLLARTRTLCQGIGVEHVLFDDARARAYIAAQGDAEVLAAYDIAVHPAMKCDVFRLCHLFHGGGYYVDADIVLKPNLEQLFELHGSLVVFQWDSKNISNLCNWLIGARAGDPTLLSALKATADSVLQACKADPEAALRNILGVSGPGVFTRGVATGLRERLAKQPAPPGAVNVETVSRAHRLIQLGPEYLKEPLGYKSDERHWRAAGDPGTPAPVPAPAPTPTPVADPSAPAAASSGGWAQRLVDRLRRGPAG